MTLHMALDAIGSIVTNATPHVGADVIINFDNKTLKRFRATLFQIEKDGLEGKHWGNSPNLIAAIGGFANFVAMVNPEKGAEFQQQVQRIKNKYVCNGRS